MVLKCWYIDLLFVKFPDVKEIVRLGDMDAIASKNATAKMMHLVIQKMAHVIAQLALLVNSVTEFVPQVDMAETAMVFAIA